MDRVKILVFIHKLRKRYIFIQIDKIYKLSKIILYIKQNR